MIRVLADDPILNRIVDDLAQRHGVHTFILYGSRARGDATQQSDYDIAAFGAQAEARRDARLFEGHYLDAWIYPEDKILTPDQSLMHLQGGIVLRQRDHLGDECLAKLDETFRAGPPPLPDWDKELRRVWVMKMLDRARVGDTEGNFRLHWLLFDLLQNYFELCGRWYRGPKESLKWLQDHEPATYVLFEKALKPGAPLSVIEALARAVIKQ